ncbi:MAG: sugar phosphate isomerase/epimerase family protein [Eubacteriales bacterium]
MKTAFSTLGCPGWSFDEIFAAAKDLKFDRIEIRGVEDEMYAPKSPYFSDICVDATMTRLRAAGLDISMFTSAVAMGVTKSFDKAFKEAVDYIDLAYKADVPYIRVMLSSTPEPDNADIDLGVTLYGLICDYAADKNVLPLVETNGVLADSSEMVSFLEKVDRANAGVLWDIHHPYRYFGEKPSTTVARLGSRIKYVHVKDSVMQDGKVSYRMMGYGDVPVHDAIKALADIGFDGCVSLEWVKRWNPSLQEPGIVLPHFIHYMEWLKKSINI